MGALNKQTQPKSKSNSNRRKNNKGDKSNRNPSVKSNTRSNQEPKIKGGAKRGFETGKQIPKKVEIENSSIPKLTVKPGKKDPTSTGMRMDTVWLDVDGERKTYQVSKAGTHEAKRYVKSNNFNMETFDTVMKGYNELSLSFQTHGARDNLKKVINTRYDLKAFRNQAVISEMFRSIDSMNLQQIQTLFTKYKDLTELIFDYEDYTTQIGGAKNAIEQQENVEDLLDVIQGIKSGNFIDITELRSFNRIKSTKYRKRSAKK